VQALGDVVTLPPPDVTPPGAARAVAVAHSADSVLNALGHMIRHLEAAQHATSPEAVTFNLRHAHNHQAEAADHQARLFGDLAAHDPAIGAELDRLRDATPRQAPPLKTPRPEDTPEGPDRIRAVAHLSQTVMTALGHIARHLDGAQHATSPESLTYNEEHAHNHSVEALDHHRRATHCLAAYYPAVARELAGLHQITQSGPEPAAAARPAPAQTRQRCDGCGELTGGGPCIECGRSANGNAYERELAEWRDKFAASSVNGVL
jgi:sorbitol-specific phosphotransferase system component IIA